MGLWISNERSGSLAMPSIRPPRKGVSVSIRTFLPGMGNPGHDNRISTRGLPVAVTRSEMAENWHVMRFFFARLHPALGQHCLTRSCVKAAQTCYPLLPALWKATVKRPPASHPVPTLGKSRLCPDVTWFGSVFKRLPPAFSLRHGFGYEGVSVRLLGESQSERL